MIGFGCFFYKYLSAFLKKITIEQNAVFYVTIENGKNIGYLPYKSKELIIYTVSQLESTIIIKTFKL